MKKNLLLALLVAAVALPLRANRSSVKIDVKGDMKQGNTITVTVHVFHDGNNFFHYTDWVYLKGNGKEIGRWTFTRGSRPEAGNFTREVQLVLDGPVDLEAMADCNVHGSEGPSNMHIEPAR